MDLPVAAGSALRMAEIMLLRQSTSHSFAQQQPAGLAQRGFQQQSKIIHLFGLFKVPSFYRNLLLAAVEVHVVCFHYNGQFIEPCDSEQSSP
jgi:hypothetical protein